MDVESRGTNWPGTTLRSIDQTVSIVSADGLDAPTDTLLELSFALEASAVAQADELSIRTLVRVPESGEEEGPAVEFFTGVDDAIEAEVQWVVGTRCATSQEGPCACRNHARLSSNAFERNLVCLPRSWSGRWYQFGVEIFPHSGRAGERSRVLVDGIRPTTSSSCACP